MQMNLSKRAIILAFAFQLSSMDAFCQDARSDYRAGFEAAVVNHEGIADQVTSIVIKSGGKVVQSSINEWQASLQLQVPIANFDSVLTEIRKIKGKQVAFDRSEFLRNENMREEIARMEVLLPLHRRRVTRRPSSPDEIAAIVKLEGMEQHLLRLKYEWKVQQRDSPFAEIAVRLSKAPDRSFRAALFEGFDLFTNSLAFLFLVVCAVPAFLLWAVLATGILWLLNNLYRRLEAAWPNNEHIHPIKLG